MSLPSGATPLARWPLDRWRRARRVGALVILTLLGVGLLAHLLLTPERIADALMSPGGRARHAPDSLPGWAGPYEAFRTQTEDGVALAGWFVSPRSSRAPRALVILCHGFGGNHTDGMGLARALHGAGGLGLVLFDFRGHGRSGAAHFTYGAHETRDLRAILPWALARYPNASVSLVGWSAGAAIALPCK